MACISIATVALGCLGKSGKLCSIMECMEGLQPKRYVCLHQMWVQVGWTCTSDKHPSILGAKETRNRWRMWWLVEWCDESVWAVTVLL